MMISYSDALELLEVARKEASGFGLHSQSFDAFLKLSMFAWRRRRTQPTRPYFFPVPKLAKGRQGG